jgi:hypothetical protein
MTDVGHVKEFLRRNAIWHFQLEANFVSIEDGGPEVVIVVGTSSQKYLR